MNKKEAIERFVSELSAIPQEWVKIVSESYGEYHTLPMWGTMWILDRHIGEEVMAQSRSMVGDMGELAHVDFNDEEEQEKVKKAIKEEDWSVLEEYIDEEMTAENCVLDNKGNRTAMFIYEIGDEYVLGVHGAGWNFYDGVWDKLYDIIGLQWHDTKCTHFQCHNEAVEGTDACDNHTFCDCPKVNGKYHAHYKPECPNNETIRNSK